MSIRSHHATAAFCCITFDTRNSKAICLLFCMFAFLGWPLNIPVAQAAPPPVRILPLGDSITDGVPVLGGYRAPLYQLLTNAGFKVDFVGTLSNNSSLGLPDPNHEGHSGYRIDQIDAGFMGWINAVADPDIILLLIGTNDYGYGQDTAHATNRLDHLISRIAATRPNAKLVVANLLLRTDNAVTYTAIRTTFNPFVPALVAKHAALGQSVYFLDLNAALKASDLADSLHPNTTGYRKMATNWFGAITNLVTPLGTTNAPVISRATGRPGWTNVVVMFSKPVAPDATNLANFALSGGLTISRATLDPVGQREVTLLTSPQTPSRFYTIAVSNVTDLSPSPLVIAPGAAATFLSAPTTGVSNNVPEAADYTRVYSLNISNTAAYDVRGVPYQVDNHAAVPNFSRVAYYLELQRAGGSPQFIWVAMDAFTCAAGKIGVPLTTNGAFFQRYVTNMNVLSSAPDIVNGNGLGGGYLEFWPTQYGARNSAQVPDASGLLYDWGDQPTTGKYGSMQIHNVPAGQTLFGFNHWANLGGAVDLGIGNNTGANPDWTSEANAGLYSIKFLQVFVLPGPTFNAGGDQTILEDAGPQVVTNWARHITPRCSFEANQLVDFIVTNTNPGLFSVPPSLDATGTLTYRPTPNANGSAWVSVRLHDQGGTADGGQDTSLPQNFQITVLPVNDPPVAVARAFPLVSLLPNAPNPFVISRNNTDAIVYFDGSLSSDVENDPLQFFWFADDSINPFASGVVATNVLGVGAHGIVLVVSDGMDTGTNRIVVNVLTAGEAVEKLIAIVNDSALSHKDAHPLLATLNAASASFDRGNPTPGINQVRAFQNKVRAQISPGDPALAETFTQAAQKIINAFAGLRAPSKIVHLKHGDCGNLRLQLTGDSGQVHLLQASTNLLDWVTVGVASDQGDGAFEFEDNDATRFPSRYYRVVSP